MSDRPERAPSPTPNGADADMPAVRAAQAERGAFDVLYRRYLDRVYAYAFYQLGDHHDAEDATERTFLAALAGLASFRDEGSTFRAWLFRIAHNTVANARRTRSRRRLHRIPEGFERPAPDADPAGQVVRADELRRVMRALADMPEERRQVVLLRFVDGLSAREIGEVLGRSSGAVRVLLHRALRDVAARLTA